jgi:membrane associated rhomboid family serine protease
MTDAPDVATPVCYRHPDRETYVRCTRCDRPICPDCMRAASVGHQCPECVAEGRRSVRAPRTAFGGTHVGQLGYVTRALIGVNVAMLVLSIITGGGLNALLRGSITPLMAWGAVIGEVQVGGQVVPYGVADGEYYRLVTAMFLHFGILHLALNMWGLWILGRVLEGDLGPWRFLALYLVAGLGGNVAAYLFEPASLTAGASTAIFGLLAAAVIVFHRLGRDWRFLMPWLVINLFFTFFSGIVSKSGHVGGLIVGGLMALGLAYAPRASRTLVQVGVTAGVVALLVAATVYQTAALNA